MTQSTKPSAGALRAAKIIAQDAAFPYGCSYETAAQIIDRETGVAELSASVKELLKAVKALHDFLWKERGQIVGMVDIELSEALLQAIAKCEHSE